MRTTLLCLALIGCGSDSNNNNQNLEDMSVPEGDFSVAPDQGAMACDPLQQDCPGGQKCVIAGFGMMAAASCVMAGAVTEGMACMRGMMGAPDNCAAGLVCSRTGNVCRKYCGADTDCPNAQKCGAGRGGGGPAGTCTPTCTPFGNDCGAQNCSTITNAFGSSGEVFFTCRTPGTGANFDDCGGGGGGGVQCGANQFCDGTNQWCAPLCDNTHACPPNSGDGGVPVSCMSLGTTIAGDPGYCAP